MKEYICDTNVIVRYLIKDNDKLFIKAKEIFDQVKEGKIKLYIPLYVFTETIYVLHNFYEVPKEEIVSTLNNLLLYKGIGADKVILELALGIYSEHNIHIVDSLLAAEATRRKSVLITFDKQLDKISKSTINSE